MAGSPKCLKCGHSTFEMADLTVRDSEYKYTSIQCVSCGSMHAVTEYYNIGFLLYRLAAKMGFDLSKK